MKIEKQVRRYNEYIEAITPFTKWDFENKKEASRIHTAYMLNRTQSMFSYSNLPESIPQRILEQHLQVNGNVCFLEHNNELMVFTGAPGGELDAYYQPKEYIIANPWAKLNGTFTIGKDCEIILNDSLWMGLLPLFARYSSALAENELSMQIATINSRLMALMTASNDSDKEAAEKFLHDIRRGKLGAIADNRFLDGIRVLPFGGSQNASMLTDLIEYEQYLKASWFNEIGLNANYNMKRESLNSAESQLNNDSLLPLVDDMLRCRREGIERVNAHFGTEIRVDYASSWEDNAIEIEAEQETISANAEHEGSGEDEDIEPSDTRLDE